MKIRNTINNILKNELTNDSVYIFLSGGVDSQSVLFSCLDLNKKVTIVSFTIDGYESRDFLCAKNIAKKLNIDFLPVILPIDLNSISTKIIEMAKNFDCKLKTDFECFYPMLFAYEAIIQDAKEKGNNNINLTSGLGADTYFLLSKKASIHYKDRPDEYRDLLYFNPNYSQRSKHEELCKMLNINHVMPYFRDEIYNLFKGKTKKEVNYPLEKNDIRENYKNELIDKLHYKHTSFQKGDSGISIMFTKLLTSEWNINNWKSVTGIYNAVVKGSITKPLDKNGQFIK